MQITDLQYSYAGTTVLNIPKLTIPRSAIYGLTGPNGAGKTTLLSLLAGILPLQRGQIETDGPCGLLLQQTSLYPEMTGYQNLAYYCALNGFGSAGVPEMLDLARIDRDTASRPVRTLSQGNRQRLLIARAFLSPSHYILLDEPFSAVDVPSILLMKEAIRDYGRDHRKTVIISSHQLREIEDLITHGVIIKQGRVVYTFDKKVAAEEQNSRMKIYCREVPKELLRYLQEAGYSYDTREGTVTIHGLSELQRWETVEACRNQQVPLIRIDFQSSLEDLFIEKVR